jgi:hypothetical protein
MNKFIAVMLVLLSPLYLLGMLIELLFVAVNDSRLYSLSMFISAIKFHYENYPLPFKDYAALIKDFWNNDYTT